MKFSILMEEQLQHHILRNLVQNNSLDNRTSSHEMKATLSERNKPGPIGKAKYEAEIQGIC